MSKREFTIANEYRYNHSGPRRWIISHVLRYKRFIASFVLASIITNTLYVLVPSLTGEAFNVVAQGGAGRGELIRIALTILAVVFCGGVVDLTARLSSEVLGKHLAADARDELYLSLLGKSQTFHNRQRVGHGKRSRRDYGKDRDGNGVGESVAGRDVFCKLRLMPDNHQR